MKHRLPVMTRRAVVSGFLSLIPMTAFCQNKTVTCGNIQQGLFYYYPKNSSDQYTERMDGQFEHETNIRSGDTTLSRIKWDKNCSFSEKYITGNTKMTFQQRQALQKHVFVYKIMDIGKDYYTFTLYMDKMTDLPLADDTMWFNAQAHPNNRLLFMNIPNSSVLRREHFKDTSRYAVVYLYRPGKFTNSLNLYPIYLDNVEMCIAENNSGYIFKVMKEGPLKITGTLFNHPSYTILPVQFGHTYYVKTKVHWGPTKNLSHVEMEVVDEKAGETGFAGVKLRSF
jgi:hypothetical protein